MLYYLVLSGGQKKVNYFVVCFLFRNFAAVYGKTAASMLTLGIAQTSLALHSLNRILGGRLKSTYY